MPTCCGSPVGRPQHDRPINIVQEWVITCQKQRMLLDVREQKVPAGDSPLSHCSKKLSKAIKGVVGGPDPQPFFKRSVTVATSPMSR